MAFRKKARTKFRKELPTLQAKRRKKKAIRMKKLAETKKESC